jgi:hypothetical protein
LYYPLVAGPKEYGIRVWHISAEAPVMFSLRGHNYKRIGQSWTLPKALMSENIEGNIKLLCGSRRTRNGRCVKIVSMERIIKVELL